MCPPFQFDSNLSPRDNIELFLTHLRAREPNLTSLLEEALDVILPLPERGPQRAVRRKEANDRVIAGLESLELEEEEG